MAVRAAPEETVPPPLTMALSNGWTTLRAKSLALRRSIPVLLPSAVGWFGSGPMAGPASAMLERIGAGS